MPAQKLQRPRTRTALLGTHVSDPVVNRAIVEVRDQVSSVAANQALSRSVISRDLALGENRFPHQLGRVARGYSITPTVADQTFAHALVSSDASMIVINVVGVVQPGATIEIW